MGFDTTSIQHISGVQIIKIPDHLKIEDDKVYLKKMGNALYIIPFHTPWESMIESVNEFSEDFMEDRAQPDQQPRESFD